MILIGDRSSWDHFPTRLEIGSYVVEKSSLRRSRLVVVTHNSRKCYGVREREARATIMSGIIIKGGNTARKSVTKKSASSNTHLCPRRKRHPPPANHALLELQHINPPPGLSPLLIARAVQTVSIPQITMHLFQEHIHLDKRRFLALKLGGWPRLRLYGRLP